MAFPGLCQGFPTVWFTQLQCPLVPHPPTRCNSLEKEPPRMAGWFGSSCPLPRCLGKEMLSSKSQAHEHMKRTSGFQVPRGLPTLPAPEQWWNLHVTSSWELRALRTTPGNTKVVGHRRKFAICVYKELAGASPWNPSNYTKSSKREIVFPWLRVLQQCLCSCLDQTTNPFFLVWEQMLFLCYRCILSGKRAGIM